jgi:hypothetical protein
MDPDSKTAANAMIKFVKWGPLRKWVKDLAGLNVTLPIHTVFSVSAFH